MNITLRTPELELVITDASHEEALDTLALLINTGVVPAEEVLDFEEEEYCGDTCGHCDCDDEEDEELSEEEQVIEFLQGLEEVLHQAFAEAAEQAKQEEEEEKKKEEKEPEQLSFEEVFNIFFGQHQKK